MNAAQLSPEIIAALSVGFSAGMNSSAMFGGRAGQDPPMSGSALPPVILINSKGACVSISKHDSLSNVLVINISKSDPPRGGTRGYEDDF
jgi:hypothetical protein